MFEDLFRSFEPQVTHFTRSFEDVRAELHHQTIVLQSLLDVIKKERQIVEPTPAQAYRMDTTVPTLELSTSLRLHSLYITTAIAGRVDVFLGEGTAPFVSTYLSVNSNARIPLSDAAVMLPRGIRLRAVHSVGGSAFFILVLGWPS